MNAAEENMTPAKEDCFEKRPKLKRIKKRKTKFDLNASTNSKLSFQSRMNISAANSSVVKASLRANNKALAQSLEKVRQDLRVAHEVNNELKKENQDLQLRLMNLERVAGLKDESLEKEVQHRIEDKTKQLKQILSNVSVHLLDAGSGLQDALDKCIEPNRLSVASSARHSSLGTSDDACSPLDSGATSSIYYNPNTFSRVSSVDPKPVRPAVPVPIDTDDPSDGMISRAQLHEMTMILEQSVMAEVEDLPTVSEDKCAGVVKPKEAVSKKTTKTSEGFSVSHKEISEVNPDLPKIPAEKTDRRGTFVVPAPVKQQEVTPIGETSVQDRRGTFVISVPVQEEISKFRREAKRETFVINPPAKIVAPKESEKENSVFKAPMPVIIHSKDLPMDEDEDMTVYPNTDMELTEVITLDQLPAATDVTENKKDPEDGKDKSVANNEPKIRSKSKIAKCSSLTSVSAKVKEDPKLSKSDTDVRKDKEESSKSAVVLQLRKPGKIVFSAARKEYDGSRKVLPSKLPSRPRTKSKKEMKELKESISADTSEPKTIFDFHDKTPVHLTEKSRVQPSVYDLPNNESEVLATVKQPVEKEVKTENNKSKKTEVKDNNDTKCDLVSITYSMPLKGSPDNSKPKGRERSRSRSRAKSKTRNQSDTEGETEIQETEVKGRSRSRGRQGRSGNLKHTDTEEPNNKSDTGACSMSRPKTRSKSLNRKRQADEVEDNETDAEKEVVIERKSRSRVRRKVPSSSDDEQVDGNIEVKSAKDGKDSRPIMLQETEITSTNTEDKQQGVSGDKDNDFKISVAQRKSVTSRRSRSKRRKQLDSEDDTETEQAKPTENEVPEASTSASESEPSEHGDRRAARTKAVSLTKTLAKECSRDNQEDLPKDGKEDKCHQEDDNVLLQDDSFTNNDLQPVLSRDFISRINSQSKPQSSTDDGSNEEDAGPMKKSSWSKVRKGTLQSETDDEIDVKPRKNTNSKDKRKGVASVTDDEIDDGSNGNHTKIVPATDDEGEEDTKQAAQTVTKQGKNADRKIDSKFDEKVSVPKKTSELSKEGKEKGEKDNSLNSKSEDKESSVSKTSDIYSLPLKGSPKHPQGRPKLLKKVERTRSHSRKRVDVQDILQAFKEADDPDHSLRLNAVSRNDSVVIAEVIRNACCSSAVHEEKVERLCDLEAMAESTEVYSLPLKDSPKKGGKSKGRGRSQSRSRGRSRSKKRIVDSDDDDFVPPKHAKVKKPNTDEAQTGCREESRIYNLPLKGSPDETKKINSRSRSQSRGRSRSRKRVNYNEESPDREIHKESESKDSLEVTFDAESPADMCVRSVKKIKSRTSSKKGMETNHSSPVRNTSRKKIIDVESPEVKDTQSDTRSVKTVNSKSSEEVAVDTDIKSPVRNKNKKKDKAVEESPERNNDVECETAESLNVTFEAGTPSNSGKRSVKKVKSQVDKEGDGDTKKTDNNSSVKKGEKSGKKSAKKKEDKSTARKSQQEELKARFNELKRKLSMMPKKSERESLTAAEKENSDSTLKRKRDSDEDKSEEGEKRSRRAAAAAVNYKEIPLGAKLRRGDPGTSHFFSSDPIKIFKSPQKNKDVPKRRNKTSDDESNDRLSHKMGVGVLDNISNTLDEAE